MNLDRYCSCFIFFQIPRVAGRREVLNEAIHVGSTDYGSLETLLDARFNETFERTHPGVPSQH